MLVKIVVLTHNDIFILLLLSHVWVSEQKTVGKHCKLSSSELKSSTVYFVILEVMGRTCKRIKNTNYLPVST